VNKIAIIGAGQAGLQLGFELLAKGRSVTIFTDKTAEEVLNSATQPVAIQFFPSLQYEQDLQLDFWYAQEAARIEATVMNMYDANGAPALTIRSALTNAPQAVDLRLKYATWMKEFERRGGELIIQQGTIELLEACTSSYDAVFVTTGKGEPGRLFERDAENSMLDQAPRHLTMFHIKNCNTTPDLGKGARVNNFNKIGDLGECIFYNFLHKDEGKVHVMLVEAVPGSALDLSASKASVREQFEYIRELLKVSFPAVYEKIRDAALLENEILKGALTPTVKKPVGKLPSGRVVMALGDALILHDPIIAQGLNAASKAAHHVAMQIIAGEDVVFDETWINQVFETYWATAGQTYQINNAMLTGLQPHQELAFYAASQMPGIAKDILNNAGQLDKIAGWFNDPGQTMMYLCNKGFVLNEQPV
jgi:2-polyprenyl-6-methoxyphenol hydroxylase-like FAD-dependent oxidoreductase